MNIQKNINYLNNMETFKERFDEKDFFNNLLLDYSDIYFNNSGWNLTCHEKEVEIENIANHVTVEKKRLKQFFEEELKIRDDKLKKNIGQLRQWLNEDKITETNKMVTNKQLEHWLLTNLT